MQSLVGTDSIVTVTGQGRASHSNQPKQHAKAKRGRGQMDNATRHNMPGSSKVDVASDSTGEQPRKRKFDHSSESDTSIDSGTDPFEAINAMPVTDDVKDRSNSPHGYDSDSSATAVESPCASPTAAGRRRIPRKGETNTPRPTTLDGRRAQVQRQMAKVIATPTTVAKNSRPTAGSFKTHSNKYERNVTVHAAQRNSHHTATTQHVKQSSVLYDETEQSDTEIDHDTTRSSFAHHELHETLMSNVRSAADVGHSLSRSEHFFDRNVEHDGARYHARRRLNNDRPHLFDDYFKQYITAQRTTTTQMNITQYVSPTVIHDNCDHSYDRNCSCDSCKIIMWMLPLTTCFLESVNTNRSMHNLSNKQLSEEQIIVLSQSLKFVPTPRLMCAEELRLQCKQFFLRFCERIRKEAETRHYKNTTTTSNRFEFYVGKRRATREELQQTVVIPPNVSMAAYISKTRRLIDTTFAEWKDRLQHKVRMNLPLAQRLALKQLADDKTLIVKPSDKNLGIVVMDVNDYDREANRLLSDTTTYKLVDKSDIPIQWIFNEIVDRIRAAAHRNVISMNELYFFENNLINPSTAKVPSFYVLPKVHKNPWAGRPIGPNHSYITSPASVWVDKKLQPAVRQVPTILLDSLTLVNMIEGKCFNPNERLTFVTADVTSLYTVIRHNAGLQALDAFLRTVPSMFDSFQRTLIVDIMRLILENNYIEYYHRYYHQVTGTAMGTSAAVMYANIFVLMQEYEKVLIDQFKAIRQIYARLLDDVFAVISGDPTPFINALQSLHSDLVLTVTTSETQCEFLDLLIFKGPRFMNEGRLDITTHQKLMNRYLYLPFKSFHTIHAKSAVVVTELKRYVRNSTSADAFVRTAQLLYQRLRARGYPPAFLAYWFRRVTYSQRAALLAKTPKESQNKSMDSTIVFNTEWNPLYRYVNIRKVLTQHWPGSLSLKKENLIVSYKRPSNIGNLLVRAERVD